MLRLQSLKIGILTALAWIPMGYALATDILKPEYFVAVTLGAVMLIFFLLRHEAERIFKAVDRIPSEEWFVKLTATLEHLETTLVNHESRLSYLEGQQGRRPKPRAED